MLRKKFNKVLYDNNNQIGINASINFFNQVGWKEIPTDEMYCDGDVIFTDASGKRVLVEIEVKNVGWRNQSFIYDTIHFAYKPKSKSDIFMSFNQECNAFFSCKASDLIRTENIIRKNTKNRMSGEITYDEPFYEINVNRCRKFIYQNNNWKVKEE